MSLFADVGFQGICATIRSDTPDLSRTPVGNNTVSSIRLGAACPDQVEVVQWFKILGLADKCLNAEGDPLFLGNGTPVTLFACVAFPGFPNPLQAWYLPRTAAHQIRIAAGDGKCLDVTAANPQSGTPVELWDCNGGPNQSWIVSRDGTIRGLAGKCLDVAGGNPEDGTRIILWDCNGGPNQKWSLKEVPVR